MPRKPKEPTPPKSARSKATPKRTRSPRAPKPIPPQVDPQVSTSEPSHSTLRTPHSALVEEFSAQYPFALDPFQEEAIAHLDAGESVMVAAPTGTGKTVVAEFG